MDKNTHRVKINVYRLLVGKPMEKRVVGRPYHKVGGKY
jgi:hypothetical protein